jgi:O-antigen/teichoic acid export membrane protein
MGRALPTVLVARRPLTHRLLPRGTMSVGAGLAVLGASSYVYLALSARALSPAAFGQISVLYSLVYTVGPGAFLPVEQELARSLADRRARGVGGAPLVRRASVITGVYAAALVVLALATGPLTVPLLFDGSWVLLGCLVLALVGLWAVYLSRGVLAGMDRFGHYGGQLAMEGGSRIAAVVVLAAIGLHRTGAYGVLIGAGLLLAALMTMRPTLSAVMPGPPARWQELSGALGWMLVGSVLAQLLVNAPPIAAKLLADAGDSAAAGQVLTGTVLARLPLFAFAAVQAALLPGLAALLATGDRPGFVRGLWRLLAVAGAVTAVTTVVADVAGNRLLHVFFGDRYDLGNDVLMRLALASGLYMGAVIVGQSLLALRRYRIAAGGWALGVTVFVAVAWAGSGLVTRVVDAFALAALTSLVALAIPLARDVRSTR